MNRLTTRNSDGAWDVPIRNDDDGAYIPSQEIIDRLAAYEDTGLEPEQCAKYAQAEKEGRYIVIKEPRSAGVHRLEELARADIEGRVLVPPCKVVDRVWLIVQGMSSPREKQEYPTEVSEMCYMEEERQLEVIYGNTRDDFPREAGR